MATTNATVPTATPRPPRTITKKQALRFFASWAADARAGKTLTPTETLALSDDEIARMNTEKLIKFLDDDAEEL